MSETRRDRTAPAGESTRAPETLADLLAGLERHGAATALIVFAEETPSADQSRGTGRQEVSFDTLLRHSRELAYGLIGQGLAPRTPVALFGTNSLDWVVARFALILADALCVPIDFDADAARLKALLADSGARRLFVSADKLAIAQAALAELDTPVELVLLDPKAAPGEGAGDGAKGAGDGAGSGAGGLPRLADLARAQPTALPTPDPDAPVAQFYTSGTTGVPKAVPLTHRNILTNIAVLDELGLVGPGDRVLLPLPLHHSYPFIVGLLLPLSTGGTVVFPAGVSGASLIAALQQARVTTLVGVPRLYEALVQGIQARIAGQGLLAGTLLRGLLGLSGLLRRKTGRRWGRTLLRPLHQRLAPQLTLLVSGGARLREEVAWGLESLGYQVLSGYGLVETTSVATFNAPGRSRLGSAGRPSRAAELRLQPVAGMDYGEVQIRGPIVFPGYANNPEANAEAFTEDGWFRSGDLGEFDADGYLFIRGRAKEVIVLPGGKNVAPEDVERIYSESPYIREIAVLELDDRLVGLIVPELGGGEPAGDIAQHIRVSLAELGQRLPGYMRLSDMALTREELPRNQLGKYKRHQLAEIYRRAERGESAPARPLSEAEQARLAQPRARQVVALLEQRFPDQTIHPDTSLQMQLGIDSLAWLELSLELERRLGISLSDEAVARLTTVGELIEAVEQAPEAADEGAARQERLLAERRKWLSEPGLGGRALGSLLYGLAWLLGRLYFRLEVEAADTLPDEGPFIVAANHASDLDPGVLAVGLPYRVYRQIWWSGDSQRLFRTRLQRAFSRSLHIFPVDGGAPAATLEMAGEVLERGRVLAWFPEEWRSPDGELLPFRPGIGALVERHRVPVVPCWIEGSFAAMPRSARLPKPVKLRLRFGPPVAPETLIAAAAESGDEAGRQRAIAAELREILAALRDRERGV